MMLAIIYQTYHVKFVQMDTTQMAHYHAKYVLLVHGVKKELKPFVPLECINQKKETSAVSFVMQALIKVVRVRLPVSIAYREHIKRV